MTLYNIKNPTPARRVIYTKLPDPPKIHGDDGKMVVDVKKSYKPITIEPGATKENVDLDDLIVEQINAQAELLGADKELQLTKVAAAPKEPKSKAA